MSLNRFFYKNILFYTLFITFFLYLIFILLSYYIEISTVKYNPARWEEKTLTGTISYKLIYPDKINYILTTCSGKVFLTDYNNKEFFLGDEVTLTCSIKNLNLKNFYESYIYNTFSTNKVGFIKEIIFHQRYNEKKLSEKIRYTIANFIYNTFYKVRETLVNIVEHNISSPYKEILLRISVGYKYQRKEEIDEIIKYFQDAGVMHVLVVSGLHVGFVYYFVYFLLKFLIFIPRKIRILISMFSVIFYAGLTGFAVPVTRATIIILCFAFSGLLNREQSMIHSLIFAAVIILFFNPRHLFTVSFQLSFLACFGILYFYKVLYSSISKHFPEKVSPIVRYILQIGLVSFSAQVFISPLLAYYFNKISLVSIVSNVVVIPLSAILVWLGLIYYFIAWSIPYLLGIVTKITELYIHFYLGTIEFFAKFPFAVIRIPTPDIASLISYYTILLVLPKIKYSKKLLSIIISGCILTIILFNINLSPKFKLTFLDVGLGDAITIFTPDKKVIMIDTGGSYESDVGKYNIVPYFFKNKVKKIDTLIITHPHYPHYLGIKSIMENFKIKEVYLNRFIPKNDVEYKNLLHILYNKNVNLHMVHKNIKITFHNGEIEIYPNYVFPEIYESYDYDICSMLIKVRYKNFVCILTNDLPSSEIKEIKNLYNLPKKISVEQFPRHGKYVQDSKNFSSKITVVSTDRINKNLHIGNIFFTAKEGNIEIISFSGEKIKKILSTFNGIRIFFN